MRPVVGCARMGTSEVTLASTLIGNVNDSLFCAPWSAIQAFTKLVQMVMEAMVLHTSVVKGVTQSGSWYMYGNTCTMNQGKQDWIAFRGIESCQAINLWSVGANIDKHRYGGQTAVWSTSIASAGEMSHSCFFWLTWRPNTKIPNRSDRGAVAVTCDLEEILPSAKISRWVNQVCRDHPTGEDYPMISAQPIIEKHGIKIASYGGATPLLVSRWSTEERSARY